MVKMKMVKTEGDDKGYPRIKGDNIDELVEYVMRFVTKHHDYYRESLREELTAWNRSVISSFSCAYSPGIVAILDPENLISDDDLENLRSPHFYRKYRQLK
jgi:hypothetical protein